MHQKQKRSVTSRTKTLQEQKLTRYWKEVLNSWSNKENKTRRRDYPIGFGLTNISQTNSPCSFHVGYALLLLMQRHPGIRALHTVKTHLGCNYCGCLFPNNQSRAVGIGSNIWRTNWQIYRQPQRSTWRYQQFSVGECHKHSSSYRPPRRLPLVSLHMFP